MIEDLAGFRRIAAVADVGPGEMRTFEVGDESVALCNVDGMFFAMNNSSDSLMEPLEDKALRILAELSSESDIIPANSGRLSATPAALGIDTFETRVRGNEVFIKLDR